MAQHDTTTGKDNLFDQSSATQELSFVYDDDEEHDSIEERPSCILLSDYESDSLEDLSYDRQDSLASAEASVEVTTPQPRKGGLRHNVSSSSSSSTTNSSATPTRSVSFAQAHVRQYALCVGDNPAVSLGVPVSIDWRVVSETTTSIDAYDAVHPHGREEEELRVSCQEREAMVRKAGFSTEQIRWAVRNVNTVKMEREQTLDTLKNASSELFLEKLRKSLWNATFRRNSKKMERALLKEMLQKDASRRQVVLVTIPAC